ncbi:GTP cyclohydrolase II [Palleronia salina]|uniref:GTP cyclohydrolase-2 n=1 Tax=Palleronia salina TaxID=313368 RepID=A0A1M6LXB5_9RHOB|nr:GTP cyclohydrolase II [Palleronia salina]
MQIFRHPAADDDTGIAALAPRGTEKLARARGDLRMGLPVLVTDGTRSALVALVEPLSDARLAALSSLGPVELALTDHRAVALGAHPAPGTGSVMRLPLARVGTAAAIRTMAGGMATLAPVTPVPPAAAEPGSDLHAAAVGLAKAEELLPAAVVVPLGAARAEAARLGLLTIAAGDILAALGTSASHGRVSAAPLPTDSSETGRVHVFRAEGGGREHSAVEVGQPDFSQPVLVRLHSACFTGDVLGSRKCDCGPQLRAAMTTMGDSAGGVLLYLNQEGRGIGLANKMRAYNLQDAGLDTVDANQWLGFDDDQRDFRIGAQMLHALGISRVRLMTNNPAKIARLTEHGIDVVERVPLQVGRSALNAHYLATKAARSGHLLP